MKLPSLRGCQALTGGTAQYQAVTRRCQGCRTELDPLLSAGAGEGVQPGYLVIVWAAAMQSKHTADRKEFSPGAFRRVLVLSGW